MEHRFRLKRGDWELELVGQRDFIEAQLALHLPAFLAQEENIQATSSIPADSPIATLPQVDPNFRPRRNISLADLVAMKGASAPPDLLVVAAYYMEKYMQRESFIAADLATELSALPTWECQQVDDVLETVLARGHLDPLRDGRYTLTYHGQGYVRDGLG